MAELDRTDTIVTEHAAAPVQTHTTVVERQAGGGSGLMIAVLLLLFAVGAFIAFQFLEQGEVRTDAVAGAAAEVGDAAQQVGDAAKDAANKIGE